MIKAHYKYRCIQLWSQARRVIRRHDRRGIEDHVLIEAVNVTQKLVESHPEKELSGILRFLSMRNQVHARDRSRRNALFERSFPLEEIAQTRRILATDPPMKRAATQVGVDEQHMHICQGHRDRQIKSDRRLPLI